MVKKTPTEPAKPKKKPYLRNGVRYAAVTSVIDVIDKPGLRRWYGDVGTKRATAISDEAKALGSRIHEAALLICRGATTIPDEPGDPKRDLVTDCARAVRWWMNENMEEVYAIEQPIWNDRFQYAGTPDLYGRRIGHRLPCVVDWKSSKQMNKEMKLQTVAYCHGEHAEGDILDPRSERIVVRIDKLLPVGADPKDRLDVHVFDPAEAAGDYQAFLYCLGIYNWLKSA